MSARYEILPFGAWEAEAAAVAPVTLTITCSPRLGVEHTLTVAERARALGHRVVPHVAARMVADRSHLDTLMERLAAAGIDDVFLIGGDAAAPAGAFDSAVELLPLMHAHELRPRRIGIGAYPEGHPLVDRATLADALCRKAAFADYMVTQLCFDPAALLRWIEQTRAAGVDLPSYVGLPGAVDRRRLLEVSMRVGVGDSIGFLRKQRGIRRLLSRPERAVERLGAAFAPLVGEPELAIEGLHFYTFNRLRATLAWEAQRGSADGARAESACDA
ncbi:methylenetetrahydrofolate reductase [Conexibacter woesei]|uniref:Methylenetetrahydrofolate reductase n=1 Tax=Conexibacter woesei (strain DSM 14684 / CCUG 47730 / CIP 108061 / JCM 11494 / NBRC 100937 / ID131577) TaxID=469383 RepID=D3F6X0_CONWI|nr:methylenetetrahydrofolate reductase [Conexibacter woesei]ADB52768.1 methylenetetrahydrofolate reductase [Conexibacter woesei DSM 14684]